MRGVGRGGRERDETFLRGFWGLEFDLDTSNFQFLLNEKMISLTPSKDDE